jgi:hypothetical protein
LITLFTTLATASASTGSSSALPLPRSKNSKRAWRCAG